MLKLIFNQWVIRSLHTLRQYKQKHNLVDILNGDRYKRDVMPIIIGKYQQQLGGYKAFILEPFPPQDGIEFSPQIHSRHAEAMRLLGKLDGITQLLPDKDFFIKMFIRKDATLSSRIEGTRATMMDAIAAELSSHTKTPNDDVDDITHYVDALNYGIQRIEELPISQRLISELHEVLMKGARSSHHAYPGEVRKSQNWIGGTTPQNASFVPPPPHELSRVIGDLENFIHTKNDAYLPLVKAAMLHAQFETIHPFSDGNGRTGRILITMFLWQEKLLEIPVLFLSAFFNRHRQLYYERLQGYHSEPSNVESWVEFFMEAVIETAGESIEISRKITKIRERDMEKLQSLGKAAAESGLVLLKNLYRQPIVDVAKVMEWTKFSRMGAQKVIDRFIQMEILTQRNPKEKYGRLYEYRTYLKIFDKE